MRIRGIIAGNGIPEAGSGESLRAAAHRMWARGVTALPVHERGRVVGMITERDVLHAVAEGASPEATVVSAHMTREPITVTSDEDCSAALQRMLDMDVPHLAVEQGGTLVGIVSAQDLLPHVIADPTGHIESRRSS